MAYKSFDEEKNKKTTLLISEADVVTSSFAISLSIAFKSELLCSLQEPHLCQNDVLSLRHQQSKNTVPLRSTEKTCPIEIKSSVEPME